MNLEESEIVAQNEEILKSSFDARPVCVNGQTFTVYTDNNLIGLDHDPAKVDAWIQQNAEKTIKQNGSGPDRSYGGYLGGYETWIRRIIRSNGSVVLIEWPSTHWKKRSSDRPIYVYPAAKPSRTRPKKIAEWSLF